MGRKVWGREGGGGFRLCRNTEKGVGKGFNNPSLDVVVTSGCRVQTPYIGVRGQTSVDVRKTAELRKKDTPTFGVISSSGCVVPNGPWMFGKTPSRLTKKGGAGCGWVLVRNNKKAAARKIENGDCRALEMSPSGVQPDQGLPLVYPEEVLLPSNLPPPLPQQL